MLLIIREMQIEATRYHLTSVRMVMKNKRQLGLMRMYRNWKYTCLVGMKNGATAMENNM